MSSVSSSKKRAAPLPLPAPDVAASPRVVNVNVDVITTAMARDAMPLPLPLPSLVHAASPAASAPTAQGTPEGPVLTPAHDAVMQGATVVLPGHDGAGIDFNSMVQDRKQAARQWNDRSRVVAILGSKGFGHGMLVYPFLRRSVEGRAMHAVCAEMRVATQRQDGVRTWWLAEQVQYTSVVGRWLAST
jgi:hypothetical protein